MNRKELRTRVYIDGYNLYYGCLKHTPHKWLDLLTLFEQHILPSILHGREGQQTTASMLPLAIKYFTAPIIPSVARSEDSVSSQARYHTALNKLHGDRIELIKGYYAVQPMQVRLIDRAHPDIAPRLCESRLAWKVEEKQSDVSLALHAYHDAITGSVDQVVVVTNDTDISPCLQMIRMHTPIIVGLVIPTTNHARRPNADLANQAHWVRTHIRSDELAASQMPRVIPGRKPTIKPDSWYEQPELLQEILRLALPVLGSRSAVFKWLEQPSKYFDDAAPITLVDTAIGAQRVLLYIRSWLANPHFHHG